MSAKRIVIVSHYYPPHVGGIEIVAYNEAKRLVALGNEVTVVTSKTKGDPASGMHEGVRVIRVSAFNGLEQKGIAFPIFSPMLLPHMWRAVRGADVVHIHDVFYVSSLSAALCARLLRQPIVVTQHVAIVAHPSKLAVLVERLVYKTSGSWIFRRAKRIVTINDRVKAFVRGLAIPADKLVDLSNGVDTVLFHQATQKERTAARSKFALPQRAFVVLFVGRFVPKKGFDSMVAANSSEYLMVFAGGETELQPKANQRFLGSVSQQQLAELYHAADLFVLPSKGEGFPLTAQEAMASGVPVVLQYDAGYDRYNLSSDHLVFIDGNSPKLLRETITMLQHDEKRRALLAKQSLRYARENFSWEHHMAVLCTLYSEAQGREIAS